MNQGGWHNDCLDGPDWWWHDDYPKVRINTGQMMTLDQRRVFGYYTQKLVDEGNWVAQEGLDLCALEERAEAEGIAVMVSPQAAGSGRPVTVNAADRASERDA